MKQTPYILLSLLILSCSQNARNTEQNNQNQDASAITPKEDSINFYNDSILTHIDAEELCEFNFDFFLPELNQKLEKYDLKLEVQTVDDYQSSFEIIINEQKVKLYNDNELSNGAFWEAGSRNFFRKVNELLKEKDINNKFYLLYGGNDLHAVFLTEKQFKTMSKLNQGDEKEMLYRP